MKILETYNFYWLYFIIIKEKIIKEKNQVISKMLKIFNTHLCCKFSAN